MAVFSLQEVKIEQVKNVANNSFAFWPESAIYGYYGGGISVPGTAIFSTIDRIDYSTENISTPSPKLSVARYSFACTSSNEFLYFGGGQANSGIIGTINKLNFINDSVSIPTSSPSFSARAGFGMATNQNENCGYICGGSPAPIGPSVEKINFSTDSRSLLSSTLSLARGHATAYNIKFGYFTGNSSNIDRIDFSTETRTLSSALLPVSLTSSSGAPNSNYFGYFFGGQVIGGALAISTIFRLDFSTESISVPSPKMTVARLRTSANSYFTYGYVGGGRDLSNANSFSTIERLDFSTETVSVPASRLSIARDTLTSSSGGQSV